MPHSCLESTGVAGQMQSSSSAHGARKPAAIRNGNCKTIAIHFKSAWALPITGIHDTQTKSLQVNRIPTQINMGLWESVAATSASHWNCESIAVQLKHTCESQAKLQANSNKHGELQTGCGPVRVITRLSRPLRSGSNKHGCCRPSQEPKPGRAPWLSKTKNQQPALAHGFQTQTVRAPRFSAARNKNRRWNRPRSMVFKNQE